jgi:hypothetical protein
MPGITDSGGWAGRWAWFVGLWAVSAAATAAFAYLLRWILLG